MLEYPSSLCGKIYLTDKNRWFILDENMNFHPILSDHFKTTSLGLHNVFDIQGNNMTNETQKNAEISFFDFLLKNKLYVLIEDDKIDNINY